MANDKCIFCLEVKTDPVGIPCGHTFCQICLENYERIGSGTNCPICRYPIFDTEDTGIEPVNFSDQENNNTVHIQFISSSFEQVSPFDYIEIENEPLLFDEFDPEVSFNAMDLDPSDESEENESVNLETSQGFSPTPSEVDSSNLFDEEEDEVSLVDTDIEEELENFSLSLTQMEYDDMEEFHIEFYHEDNEHEYTTDLSDDESDNES